MQLDGAALSYSEVAGLAALFGLLLGFLIYRVALARGLSRRLEKDYRKRQDEFVALASHYLLNPITIIQTAVSRLQQGNQIDDAERRKLYDAIMRGQQRLWITAEQMLLVGQIDDGKLALKLAPGDLNDTVTEAITAVDAFARQKQVTVSFQDQTKGEQTQVKFDVRRLKQAFIAVIDNAVKFSPDGAQVKVIMRVDGGVCQVLVQDDGPGMPDEVIRRATQRFFRGTSAYNFDYEGMGLGLFIANTIIGMHQGVLHITSQPKRGTQVLIEFPND